ncbi:hypothetical protein E4U48_000010 [Claviceps purpurea]|nr:hypothetical protein E4U27_002192 [Claviceps purpurea]KAG6284031.1 hypothetical protein E4U48_000010 [Claviceps purpurea]
MSPGKVAGEDTTAHAFLGKHLDDLNRSFQVKKEVFTKLSRTLGRSLTARHLVSMVLEHLNTKVFDSDSLHDCFPGMPSSTPKTASHDANPPTRDGLGGNPGLPRRGPSLKAKTKEAQEDIFVSWSRPEPFQLRHKLVTLLKGSPSDIQHVRRTREL